MILKVFLFELLFVFGTIFKGTNSKSITNFRENALMLDNFIANLLQVTFPNCTSVLLQAEINNEYNFNHISTQISTSRYIAKFLSKENGTSSEELSENFLHMGPFMTKRLSDHCSVGLIYMKRTTSAIVQRIRNFIAPKFMSITRKDEDHYFYILNPERHEQLLKMHEFPNITKFKIAVGVAESRNKPIRVSMLNFFGGYNGSPKLIQIDVHNTSSLEGFDYFPDFLWNFNGAMIKITLPVTKALVEPEPSRYLNNGKTGRWTYLIEELFIPKFNLTYHMFLSTDENGREGAGGTGLLLPNNTWVGVTGDILYGRADMSVGIANTEKRNKYISFTDAHMEFACLTFVTGQPVKIFSTQAMFWPFTTSLWLLLILCCIIGIILIVILKIHLRRNTEITDHDVNSIQEIRIMLAPLLEQDWIGMPESTPLRSFVAFWSFFVIIMTTLYRSKLVTLLAFPVVETSPTTFAELAFSTFQIAFMKHGDSALNTLKASSDPVYVNLVERMEVLEGVGLNCLEKVVKFHQYACIAYDFDIVYLKERNLTDVDARKLVNAINGRTYNVDLGLSLESYSKYRPNFNKVLALTMPFHLPHFWNKMNVYKNVRQVKRKWWKETNQVDKLAASHVDDEGSDNLTLKHILGVFYMLFVCTGVTLLVFIGEHLYFRFSNVCFPFSSN